MTCVVCQAGTPGAGACPQCGYDSTAPGAREPGRVLAARDEFRAKTLAYAPQSRVTMRDKLLPWGGLLVGIALLLLFLRACSTGGAIF